MDSFLSSTPLLPRHITPEPGSKFLWRAGAIFVATGMLVGAFGAHALRKKPEDLQAWRIATNYAIYNGLGLLLVSMHPRFAGHRFAGPAIVCGGSLFSGSIVAKVLGMKFLGPITPLGGMVMIAG
ncbi:hypothetical protein AX15_006663 [Amanita polypyramis BW_CC]|nr:hypothetical protein AX15_006663 [Amanita polypyramis BW_CC]